MTILEIITAIDGPEFGRQREVLTRVIDCEGYRPDEEDLELLDGLRNLIDCIADYASDAYDIECSYGLTAAELAAEESED